MIDMRMSLVLDEESRQAARDLARHYDCSLSEAIRRSILAHWDAVMGVTPELRRRRTMALRRLIELYEGTDPEEEIARLKGEDERF